MKCVDWTIEVFDPCSHAAIVNRVNITRVSDDSTQHTLKAAL